MALQNISQPEYRDEMLKRFKLDVVVDESLEGASDDRVREEFRAWMQGLDFTMREDEREMYESTMLLSTLPIPNENICLVLDEAKITMLASIVFGEPEYDLERLEGMTVRAIDGTWKRPMEEQFKETYRGVGDLSITGLATLYELIACPLDGAHSSSGIMHDLHPLQGVPVLRWREPAFRYRK